MSASSNTVVQNKIGRFSRMRKLARDNRVVVIILAVLVAATVTGILTRRVLAAKHQVRVLDCPVTTAVAHHHDESCYDEDGDLVCTLPERDAHVHDESCYERQLVCGLDQGEGAHYHGEDCFDEDGELVCGQEEGNGHQHDENCYADVLVCGQDELAEEHVHGDGCFLTVAANEDAEEYVHPAQTFGHDVRDADHRLALRIDVDAPQGALPRGASMDVQLVDDDKLDLELVQKALDDRVAQQKEAAQKASEGDESVLDKLLSPVKADAKSDEAADEALEAGKLLRWQAVDVTFRDSAGNEIQPAKEVTVRLTSKLAQSQDAHAVVSVEDEAKLGAASEDAPADEAAVEGGDGVAVTSEPEAGAESKPEPTAKVVDQLSEKQLKDRKLALDDDQLAFAADRSTTYVLATTSLRHEMESTDGATVTIDVNAPAEAGIPADAVLDVTKVGSGDEGYSDYLARTVEAMGAERTDVALAQFFDIKIKDEEGNEVHPQAPADVRIELADIPEAPSGFAAVHFREGDEAEGEARTELEQLQCGGENGTVTFAADGFSVYGIVYTVDFGYEVDGQLYEYTLPGGGSVGLRELVDALHIHEGGPRAYGDVASFMADVQNVTFSDPGLVWVQRVPAGERKELRDILDEQGLQPEYTAETTQEQKEEWLGASYEDDWVLVSLRPFATTEMLTVTMTDGTERLVQVTDTAADGIEMEVIDINGQPTEVVKTIPNPAGTTIDLIDYWFEDAVDNGNSTRFLDMDAHDKERKGWPGASGGWLFDYYSTSGDGSSSVGRGYPDGVGGNLLGNGNWKGINAGHSFRFSPAMDNSVINGTDTSSRNSGGVSKINTYTGNANPLANLVESTLDEGYPKLTTDTGLGTGGERLDYLFDDSAQSGKAYYGGVNQLLYVDPEGYYMFDSHEYWADFQGVDKTTGVDTGDNTFIVTPQTRPATVNGKPNEARGFWPFGEQAYWHGMHMKSEFSVPTDGKVLSPTGSYNPMTFEFEGDDDTWLYIDGVLVGDGGGIHNITQIKIDYSTGDVLVTGVHPGAGDHQGTSDKTISTTLLDLFRAAGANLDDFIIDESGDGSIEDEKGSGNPQYANYFRSGTYHTFDMFYLERGGGESNLYIRYNLVSTDDFTAHKTYAGSPDDSTDFLHRNQYQFELVGLKGRYPSDGSVEEGVDPIMPTSSTTATTVDGHDALVHTVGVMEDGNVNFGQVIVPDGDKLDVKAGTPPTYRYMIREIIPPTAVDVYGRPCTDETRKESRWFFDAASNKVYDGQVYYMTGTVTTWGEEKYGISKRYYTDDAYDTLAEDVHFANFDNAYVKPLNIDLHKVGNDPNNPMNMLNLNGAEFKLSYAVPNADRTAWVASNTALRTGTTPSTGAPDGTLCFDGLTAGCYILEETRPPAGYKPAANKWLVELEMVPVVTMGTDPVTGDEVEVDRHYEVRPKGFDPDNSNAVDLTPLNLDGTVVVDQTDTLTLGPVSGEDATYEMTIRNAVVPEFSFDVVKQWEGVSADDANELGTTKVTVTVGRYRLEKQAGTLNITKTLDDGTTGVPAGTKMSVTYTIQELEEGNPVGAPIEVAETSWDGVKGLVRSLSLKPGTYRVTETVDSNDSRYAGITHGCAADGAVTTSDTVHSVDVIVEDGGMVDVPFTYAATPLTGSLKITSNLDDSDYSGAKPISTSNVTYTVMDADGVVIGTYRRNDMAGSYGQKTRQIDGLLIGEYTVVEEGWDSVASGEHSHSPADQDGVVTISNTVEQGTGSTPAEFVFNTSYSDRRITVKVFKYNWNDQVTYDASDTGVSASLTGNKVRLTFNFRQYMELGKDVRVGSTHGGSEYHSSCTSYMRESNPGSATFEITLPANDPEPKIYVGSKWGADDVYNFSLAVPDAGNGANGSNSLFAKSAGMASQGGRLLAAGVRNGAKLRDSDPADALPAGLPPAPDGMKYVIDGTFSEVRELAIADINSGVWKEAITGIEGFDRDFNPYYYYIAGVVEENVPSGNVRTIVNDVVWQDESTFHKTGDLSLKNSVSHPVNVDLYKVDASDANSKLAGATFHLLKSNGTDDERVVELTVVTPVGGTTAVLVDGASGEFTVPDTGVTIVGLEAGSYKLVEDAPPRGYVLLGTTEYAFTVNRDGTIDQAPSYVTGTTLSIPNTPGEELPMSGGSGTVLSTVAGVALATFGALTLLRNRHRARVGERD